MRVRGNPLLKRLDRWVGIPLVRLLGARTRKDLPPPASPRSLLLIKMGAIGDTLLTLPAFGALRDRFPAARLTLLHMPANRDVALRASGMDERIELNLNALFRRPLSFFALIHRLRRRRFDLVLDFEPWSRLSAFLSILSGASYRVGFHSEGQHREAAYHKTVEHRSDMHEMENNNRLVEAVGASAGGGDIAFPLAEADSAVLDRLAGAGVNLGRAIVFHPWSAGYKGHFKEWPADRFAELGLRLRREGWTLLITGGPDDRAKSLALRDRIGDGCKVLAGEATLGETAAVLQASRLVICVNTGALHLAAAVGGRILLLDGPAGELRWGPVSANARVIRSRAYCSPCLHLGIEYRCRSGWCMREIGVDEVHLAAREYLQSDSTVLQP